MSTGFSHVRLSRVDVEALPRPATAGPTEEPPQAERPATGLSERWPGRPSLKTEILDKLNERSRDGSMLDSLAGEARWIFNWSRDAHRGREGRPSTPKVIENQIRDEYNRLKRHAATPAK